MCVNIYAIRLATKRDCCNGSDSRVINSRTDGDSACLQIGRRLPVITTTSINSCEFAYIIIYGETAKPVGRSACLSVFPSRANTSVDREKLISIPRLPCKRKTIAPYNCCTLIFIYHNELAGISNTRDEIIIISFQSARKPFHHHPRK